MQGQFYGTPIGRNVAHGEWRDWMRNVIALLDSAIGHLPRDEAAHGAILAASSLLRRQLDPRPAERTPDAGKEHLLAWQVRKVLDHIDRQIGGRVLVAHLSALVGCSNAHFARSFKRTFGYSPHAFVIRRRIELAATYMLETAMPLSDVALRCGFVDQAHLCKHFRAVTGETPAAWRRTQKAYPAEPSR